MGHQSNGQNNLSYEKRLNGGCITEIRNSNLFVFDE